MLLVECEAREGLIVQGKTECGRGLNDEDGHRAMGRFSVGLVQ